MTINRSILGEMAAELSFDTSTLSGPGTWDLIGVLAFEPVHIIFDSQSDVTVEIGNDASTVWKTFAGGTAVLLDMRANHGKADNFLFRKGMPIYIRGTAGAADNSFNVSYTYALRTIT